MKNILILFCLMVTLNLQAQEVYTQQTKTFKAPEIICPGSEIDHHIIIEARKLFARNKNLRGGEVKKSQFIVSYYGFTEEAKLAFQRAIDIWEYLISSPVPIRVSTYWQKLDNQILGSANAADFAINFPGAKYVQTYYPIALAEKLAGKPINNDNADDISCRFNSGVRWYYGDSGENIPVGAFDLTTVVLHELGHGLGFFSTMETANNAGSYGFGTPYKTIYDVFIESKEGKKLIDTNFVKNNTNALYQQLTSKNLFFENVKPENRPKLFAPSSYITGSSISHLDDETYFNDAKNKLMTSTVRTREFIHDPGPVALGMLYKMGWKGTSIVHEPMKNFLEVKPITFKVNILSDTTLKQGSVKLKYQDNTSSQEVELVYKGGTLYEAVVNFPSNTSEVKYYFELQDDYGEAITAPASNGVSPTRFVYSFKFGKDAYGPMIFHAPFKVEDINMPKVFLAMVEDDFEDPVEKINLNYKVNEGAVVTVPMKKYNKDNFDPIYSQGSDDDILYILEDPISGLKSGDKIAYQISAQDKSGNNTTIPQEFTSTRSGEMPTKSFYEFTVTSLLQAKESYSTDFENAENDFANVGFRIIQSNGFPSKGLNSSHPYKNGLGALDPSSGGILTEFERNEMAMLRYPIRLNSSKASKITFDEVVLVEPGENRSIYGDDNFYDYVVVEGSLDGVNWFPLEDGYDSREYALWAEKFKGSMSTGDYPNSTAVGNVTWTKKREIVFNAEDFGAGAGSVMLIRFRLYSDQLSNGWGWSIDNLFIQETPPIILSNTEPTQPRMSISPNPVRDEITVNASLSVAQIVELEIFGVTGGKIYSANILSSGTALNQKINVVNWPSGTYVVRLKEQKGVVFKRFVKL